MSTQTLSLTDELRAYLLSVSLREPEPLRKVREETASHPDAEMQIAPEQGQFMYVLARMLQVRRALEVGVFTGYSSLWVALALPVDGRLTACDVSAEYTADARRHWEAAGVSNRIELRLGPAQETLSALLSEGRAGIYDFAFIDADKIGYDAYFERCLQLVRPGGVILLDNMLRGGRVADPTVDDQATRAIRQLNEKLRDDPRIEVSLLPVGDGLTLAWKRD